METLLTRNPGAPSGFRRPIRFRWRSFISPLWEARAWNQSESMSISRILLGPITGRGRSPGLARRGPLLNSKAAGESLEGELLSVERPDQCQGHFLVVEHLEDMEAFLQIKPTLVNGSETRLRPDLFQGELLYIDESKNSRTGHR